MVLNDPDRLLAQLHRLAAEIVTPSELEQRVRAASSGARRLRVKMGIDPTFVHVHVGHAVPLRVLRLFQEHGHLAVLILGDATARLGDPTGRNEQRPPLSEQEVERNAASYLDQIGKVLDLSPERCEVRRNSEWFGRMDFFDGLRLASRATVARLLERDDFQKRMAEKLPIHLHETLYPLMQAWDSVQVAADVELGGRDQLFNLHMGRLLQEREGQPPQVCLTTSLLAGTDGRKMSKTYGNHVALADPPDEVFGKVMSLADEAMPEWFRLLTGLDPAEVETLLAGHPREAKARLAREVTDWLHGEGTGAEAEAEFNRRFRDKQLPSDVPEIRVAAGDHPLPGLMKAAGLVQSTSEARRLLQQGGVRLDGEICRDAGAVVTLAAGGPGRLLQAGRRRFARLLAD